MIKVLKWTSLLCGAMNGWSSIMIEATITLLSLRYKNSSYYFYNDIIITMTIAISILFLSLIIFASCIRYRFFCVFFFLHVFLYIFFFFIFLCTFAFFLPTFLYSFCILYRWFPPGERTTATGVVIATQV